MDLCLSDLYNIILCEYQKVGWSRVTIGFGFILHTPILEEYKYYYVSENSLLFEWAYTIDSVADVGAFFLDVPSAMILSSYHA